MYYSLFAILEAVVNTDCQLDGICNHPRDKARRHTLNTGCTSLWAESWIEYKGESNLSTRLHLVLFPDVGVMWPAAHSPASVTSPEWGWTSFSIGKGERASDQKIHMIMTITITSHSGVPLTTCLSKSLRNQSAEAGERACAATSLCLCGLGLGEACS